MPENVEDAFPDFLQNRTSSGKVLWVISKTPQYVSHQQKVPSSGGTQSPVYLWKKLLHVPEFPVIQWEKLLEVIVYSPSLRNLLY